MMHEVHSDSLWSKKAGKFNALGEQGSQQQGSERICRMSMARGEQHCSQRQGVAVGTWDAMMDGSALNFGI